MAAAVSTTFVTVIDNRAGGKVMCELVKDAVSRAVDDIDLISIVDGKVVRSNELMVPIARLVITSTQKILGNVENVSKKKDKVTKVPFSLQLSEPFNSESLYNARSLRRNGGTMKNKRGDKMTSLAGSDRRSQFENSMATKPLGCLRKKISSIPRRNDAPNLTVIKPVLENFAESLDYQTHRSRKKDRYFNGNVVLSLAQLVRGYSRSLERRNWRKQT